MNIEKVFVEQRSGRDGHVRVMLVLEDRLVSLDPLTGQVASSQPLSMLSLPTAQMDFIMVRQHNGEVLLAVPKSGEGQVAVLAEGITLDSANTPPLFFTSIDRENGRINGHSINTKKMTAENTWKINLGAQNTVVDVTTQYETASAAAHVKSVLPTAFGQDGQLFYKYLDTNMFSVVTASASDPSLITIYLINGVTGRIIYQF